MKHSWSKASKNHENACYYNSIDCKHFQVKTISVLQCIVKGFLLSAIMASEVLGIEFVITPEKQTCDLGNGSGTCWAACCQMILKAYGFSTTQTGIINYAYNNTCSTNDVLSTCDGNYLSGTCTAIDKLLDYYGQIGSNWTKYNISTGGGNLSQSDLPAEINDGRPIIATWYYYSTGFSHDLLIIGYTGAGGSDAGNVVYNDPADGSRHQMSFASFVQTGNTQTGVGWAETLRLTTNQDYPIPTPVGGSSWVQINTGGTMVITPTTSSLSYSAFCCCLVNWNWKLILMDVNGPVVVASGAKPTDNQWTTTWNIANFTMPAGHQWYYDYNGKIPGRVELEATIDNSTVYDSKGVVFAPSNLHPGNIVFADQTVMSSHSDVKAHNSIQVLSSNVQSTGSINFKSGNTITIQNGVMLNTGSSVTFQIDPTLQ